MEKKQLPKHEQDHPPPKVKGDPYLGPKNAPSTRIKHNTPHTTTQIYIYDIPIPPKTQLPKHDQTKNPKSKGGTLTLDQK